MERLIGAVLFLISFPSLAQQSCPIGENRLNSLAGLNTVIKLDDDIRAIAQLPEEKVWQAATEEMVAMANCKAEIPSQAQMLREIENFRDDQEGSSLNGFELEGEDKDLIRHFSEMINKEKSPLDDLDVTTDLSDEKYDECSDVVCLAQKTFGPERGIKYLYMKTKFGLNPSHLVESDARAWQENEIDPYLKGVLSLPSFMLPMSENRQFIHDKHDKGNTMANATITFFSGLDDKSNEQKEYTSFHEMAHYISGELEIDHDPEWLALSGWKEDLAKRLAIESGSRRRKLSNELSSRDNSFGSVNLSGANNRGIGLGSSNLGLSPSTFGMEEIKIDFDFEKSMLDIQIFHYAMEAEHPHRCVSQYGETNPAEDFAESVAAYRYNPEALKNASLEKYEFIKNKVFQGVEFDSSEKCSQFF